MASTATTNVGSTITRPAVFEQPNEHVEDDSTTTHLFGAIGVKKVEEAENIEKHEIENINNKEKRMMIEMFNLVKDVKGRKGSR